jgi:hypothetical protein
MFYNISPDEGYPHENTIQENDFEQILQTLTNNMYWTRLRLEHNLKLPN